VRKIGEGITGRICEGRREGFEGGFVLLFFRLNFQGRLGRIPMWIMRDWYYFGIIADDLLAPKGATLFQRGLTVLKKTPEHLLKSVPYEKDNCHQSAADPRVLSFFTIYVMDGRGAALTRDEGWGLGGAVSGLVAVEQVGSSLLCTLQGLFMPPVFDLFRVSAEEDVRHF